MTTQVAEAVPALSIETVPAGEHEEIIKWLKAASAHLSNAAYYLEHTDAYGNPGARFTVAQNCAFVALDITTAKVQPWIDAHDARA